MDPNTSPNLPVGAANLPPISGSPQNNLPSVPATASSAGGSLQQAAARAKQTLDQYGRDPYKMSIAFGQLKSGYIADQYHISPNAVEN